MVTTGTNQGVTLITEKDIAGATCELADSGDGKWFANGTPGTISVRKGDGPMTVTCRKEGYLDTTTSVEETLTGATFGNVIPGEGIGILVDAMPGSAQRYPDQIVVWMEPEQWVSVTLEQGWQREKQDYETKPRELYSPRNNTQAPFGQ